MTQRPALAVCVLAVAASSVAADKVSGTFNYRERNYAVKHAVAFHEGPFVKVALSDKPFDPAFGKDGSYTDQDLMSHPSASMVITIDPERREYAGVRFRDDNGSGADFRCEDPALLTLKTFDAKTLAGTFKCEEHDVTFETAVLPTP